jgi:plastocyanin
MPHRRSAAAWLAAALLLAACAGAGTGATPSVELAAESPAETPSPSPTDSPRAEASHDMSLADEYGDGGAYGGGSDSSGGSAGGGNPAGDGETATVMMMGYEFSDDITVAAGTTVTFINHDGGAHTVTEGVDGVAASGAAFDEEVPAGGSVDIAFDEPGTYDVTCLIHPTMNMVVTVEG